MTLKSLAASWNRFFFAPESPLPIAVFRIVYGALVAITLLLLSPDWLNWYGTHAWVSPATMHRLEPGTRINLFALLPQSDAWICAFLILVLAAAICLSAGFLTRLSSVIVFLGLASIDQRNLYILHGGDTFLRLAGFFLMFAPAGAALSVDRWLRMRRGKPDTALIPIRPWAQRMIQFELSLLYFAAFWWKAQGTPWVQGTALGYVYHLDELRRFPVPDFFMNPTMISLETWGTLALEFSLGVLIWFKDIRYYLLAVATVFHLAIELTLNIPMFEWDVLAGYLLFIDAADMERVWNWTREHVHDLRRQSPAPARMRPAQFAKARAAQKSAVAPE